MEKLCHILHSIWTTHSCSWHKFWNVYFGRINWRFPPKLKKFIKKKHWYHRQYMYILCLLRWIMVDTYFNDNNASKYWFSCDTEEKNYNFLTDNSLISYCQTLTLYFLYKACKSKHKFSYEQNSVVDITNFIVGADNRNPHNRENSNFNNQLYPTAYYHFINSLYFISLS